MQIYYYFHLLILIRLYCLFFFFFFLEDGEIQDSNGITTTLKKLSSSI